MKNNVEFVLRWFEAQARLDFKLIFF